VDEFSTRVTVEVVALGAVGAVMELEVTSNIKLESKECCQNQRFSLLQEIYETFI